jgi:hypothetical protein
MSPPSTWAAFDQFGACRSCDHGGRDRACRRSEVAGSGRALAFVAARATGGACGPDARYLTVKGFDYSKECTV